MLEVRDWKNLSFEEYTSLRPETILFTEVSVLDSRFNRPYHLRFFDTRYLIETEKRNVFLEQGTEQVAQDALVDAALRIRNHTGGQFDIHPFYGAVNGTKLTTVAPGFLTDLERLDDALGMFVWTAGLDTEFDSSLTQISQRLGTEVKIPSPEGPVFAWYLQATRKANPNQRNSDQARANGLQQAWEEQFTRFNVGDIPQPIELTPPHIVSLLRGLSSEGIVDSRLTNVRTRIDPQS